MNARNVSAGAFAAVAVGLAATFFADGFIARGGPSSATAEMTDALRFAPATVRIPAGGTVTWTNPSAQPHTATDGADTFDSGNVSPGGSYSHTFQVAGTYSYICIPHESQGMRGTVVVE